MRVELLGPISVVGPSGTTPIGSLKLQVLVAVLGLAAPGPVSDDRLFDELWGDDQPAKPGNALQQLVSQLRRIMGRSAVLRQGTGYALDVEVDSVDAHQLGRLLQRGREAAAGGDPRGAAQHYRAALDLVRARPFFDGLDHPLLREAATEIDEQLVAAGEGLVDAELASGRDEEALEHAARLTRDYPLRERLHGQLMVALYRCGRQADALRAFQDARHVLLDELGIDPGPELVELERAILDHDPSLAGPATRSPLVRTEAVGDRPNPYSSDAAIVGREHELTTLRADLTDALAGRGRVVLLSGEPGIGKTRLAAEMSAEAFSTGVLVAWGRSLDGGGAPAFWAWAQLLRTILEATPPDQAVEALGRGAPDLAQVVPEIADLVADLSALPATDPETARFRVCDALLRALRDLARRRPLVLVLDDLHLADPASLQMLTFLAPTITDVPVLVVATFRTFGARAGAAFNEALGELVRHPIVRRLEVTGLDADAVAEILDQRSLSGFDDEALGVIHRRTQGNPFFVTQMLELMATGATPPAVDDLRRAIPAGVREVVRLRVAALDETTVQILEAAAVLGMEFDAVLVASMIDAPPEEVLEWLGAALDAAVVVEVQDRSIFRFVHGLLNETIYSDLVAARRTRLHERAALALEKRHGDEDGPHLSALADHWFHAVPTAAPLRGIEAGLRAAAWAEGHIAHGQAAAHLHAALDLVTGLPQGRERLEQELALQERLSALLIVTGGYTADGIEEVCTRMRELSVAVDDRELLLPALWRLSAFASSSLRLDTGIELGRQLLHLAGSAGGEVYELAGHMAVGTPCLLRGDIDGAHQHFERSVALCASGHDRSLDAVILETPGVWAHGFGAWTAALHGDTETATELVSRTIDAGRRVGPDTYGGSVAAALEGWVALVEQRADVLLERCDGAVERSMAAGLGTHIYFLAFRGWARGVSGDVEAGIADIEAASAAMREIRTRLFRPLHLGLIADVLLRDGRPEEALRSADAGMTELQATGERWFEAELHRLSGAALAAIDPSDQSAGEELRAAIAIASGQGAHLLRARADASLAEIKGSR